MTVPGGDRIKELSNTSGTGSFALSAPVAGEPVRAFAASEDGQYIRYVAKHVTAQEAEAGVGLYTHSTRTLTRIYRSYPSEGAAAVNFSAGGVHVANTASVRDVLPWLAASDPTVNDDVAAGFIRGNKWINTASGAVFVCVDPAAGAAEWDQINAAAGAVGALGDITDVGTAPPTAGHLIQGDGDSWEGILASLIVGDFRGAGSETLAAAFAATAAGADTTPAADPSVTGATYTLSSTYYLHRNGYTRTSQASQRLNIPAATPANHAFLIYFDHDGATVGVVGDVGSINGISGVTSPVRGINGGLAVAMVDSNAGSAPAVSVRGNIIVAPTAVGAKTYDADDSGQVFRVTAGTQTFSAAANYPPGFEVFIKRETAGTITIDGLDADYTISGPDFVYVSLDGTALTAVGKAGVVTLDAA